MQHDELTKIVSNCYIPINIIVLILSRADLGFGKGVAENFWLTCFANYRDTLFESALTLIVKKKCRKARCV